MSIYIMTVGELAKKRGQPVGEFVKAVQAIGFDAGSHAKKLTQADLDVIIGKLDGTEGQAPVPRAEKVAVNVENPNVLMIKVDDRKTIVAFVDAKLNEDGTISVEVISSSIENGIGETLLEYRKQVGSKLGVN
jgi:hypothetical protein